MILKMNTKPLDVLAHVGGRPQNPKPTLTVVLYGGPGTGKSTTCAGVFALLKQRGYNVEMVHEYAKDLTWEEATGRLGYQPHIAGEQLWRLRRLEGKVDAIITDTSPLLSLIYGGPANGVTPAFRDWLLDDERQRNTLNVFLDRDPHRLYNPKGRSQSEAEARQSDQFIHDLLEDYRIPYITVGMGDLAARRIAVRVERCL